MVLSASITAIFDIGKTNKKFLLFDENYAVIEKYQTKLEQTVDDDGDPCEDLGKLQSWIRSQFQMAKEKYPVRALNFSAYGASFVHIDYNGKPVTPLYSYLKGYPEELLDQFYNSVGGKEKFLIQTASPPIGMLNSGLQLYWLKYEKPESFEKIDTSLHLPNYLSYLFTEKKISELTSIGCHTGLWNFDEGEYHHWLENENVQSLLPSLKPVFRSVQKTNMIKVGTGIHDSSAALAPYLIGMVEPFLLISTGTWSISLNPFNDEPLSFEELERDCLCYLDIYGNQVKASRFFLGAEYSHQKKRISEHFSVSDKELVMEPDPDLLNQLIQKKNSDFKLELEQAHSSGPFPQKEAGDWQLNRFSSPKEVYHQLMLDLVTIQAESIRLVEGSKGVDQLIITGGFSQNDLFVSLLASFFPAKQIYTSKLSDASALGAAMVLNEKTVIASEAKQSHRSHESHLGIPSQARNDLKELLDLNLVEPIKGMSLKNYSWV